MQYLNEKCSPEQNLIVMGDFNISPEDKDIGIGEPNRKRWLRDGKTSFLPEEREWWGTLINWGLKDTFRQIHPDEDRIFSWFDYRSKGFADDPKRGLRIDTLLATNRWRRSHRQRRGLRHPRHGKAVRPRAGLDRLSVLMPRHALNRKL